MREEGKEVEMDGLCIEERQDLKKEDEKNRDGTMRNGSDPCEHGKMNVKQPVMTM